MLHVDLYLFRFVQERRRNTTRQRSAWINFFIFSSMHVYVLPLTNTRVFFSLHIINFPLLYSTLQQTNESKKKRENALNTYVVSRTMRPSVTKTRRRHFPSSLPFLSFPIYLSFVAPSSLTKQDSIRPSCILYIPTAVTAGFSCFDYNTASFLFLYIKLNIYPIERLFFLPSSKKKTNTDCLLFLCGTFCACLFLCFDCCCCSSSSFLVPITICMRVCMKKRNEKRNMMMMKDEQRERKKEIENCTFMMIMVVVIILIIGDVVS